ncbi:hypothetical protein, partial [Parafrankia sp. FMc2]|uniref:hypothetical protein n=1 Tax=Parafrankia sp. FMc2 TaxID=3233196 RepID=UPI0034D4EEB8
DTPGPYGLVNHAAPTPPGRRVIEEPQPATKPKTDDLRDLTSYSLRTTEINEVIPGIAFLAAAGAFRIGAKVKDKEITEKALQLGEGCAIQIYDVESNGYAFATPESWFVDDHLISRFPGYTRTRSVWSLYDAVSEIAVKKPS